MMELVADTSPIIFLAKVGKLELLEDYALLVPSQVIAEVRKGKDEAEVIRILDFLEKGRNVRIEEAPVLESLPEALGMGERAAISLAVRRKVLYILLDERRARRVARVYGLKPRGTLWVLKDALRRGKLGREEVVEVVFDLVKEGFRIREELLAEFLQDVQRYQDGGA